MRHIPTSAEKVETMKRHAKRLQRNGGGKHGDLLNRVARQNGYEHWKHVTTCARDTLAKAHGDMLIVECHDIAAAELSGKIKVVITGPESSVSQPFVLLSTGVGDAWLLDPCKDRAACVVWQGHRRASPARITGDRLEILWDGTFELLGQYFRVETGDPTIGTRAISGYPLDGLRDALERARTVDDRIHAIFDQPDALELSDTLIADLARAGWEEAGLRDAAAAGGRYSPSRNSILMPPQGGVFDPHDDDESSVVASR